MRRLRHAAVLAWLAAVVLVPSVHAFPNSKARLQLHLTRPDLTASCGDLDASALSVPELKLTGVGGPWLLWVLVSDTKALAAAGFSVLADPGVKILAWHMCGDMEFPIPPWPRPGGANTVVWVDCQAPENELVAAGFFLLDEGSEGTVRVVQHSSFNEIQVADCDLHTEAIPDSCAAAVAVWPDSTTYRRRGLAWRPARERPEPAEPDSVIIAREIEKRRRETIPESPVIQPGEQDSATVPAITDTLRPTENDH